MPRRPYINWKAEPDTRAAYGAWLQFEKVGMMAMPRLQELATRGSIASMILLGWASEVGHGLPRDVGVAEAWYRKAADAGSSYAGYSLGELYLRLRKYALAFDAFKETANRGYLPGLRQVGMEYWWGRATEKDVGKAKDYLERAIAGGSILAKVDLAAILFRSPGWSDKQRALGLFLRALWETVTLKDTHDDRFN